MATAKGLKIIKQAKLDYEKAKKKGDAEGMAKAHKTADLARGFTTTTGLDNGKYIQRVASATVLPRATPKAVKVVSPWTSAQGTYNNSVKPIPRPIPRANTNILADAFDTKENYIDKFKQGNIAGGVANFAGGMLTGAQSVSLNALNAVDSVASGKGLPKFQYNMSKDMYNRAIVGRDGETETIKDKISNQNKVLGGIYGVADEILSDPLELTPMGYLNDIKLVKGGNQTTQAYAQSLKNGKMVGEIPPITLKSGKTVTSNSEFEKLPEIEKAEVIEAVEKEMKSVEVKNPVTKPLPNKVTDSPDTLYHGTWRKHKGFDDSQDFYFTKDKEYAKSYIREPKEGTDLGGELLNGKLKSTAKVLDTRTEEGKRIAEDIIKSSESMSYNGVDSYKETHFNDGLPRYAQKEFAEIAKEKGYDALVVSERDGVNAFRIFNKDAIETSKANINTFKGTPQPLPKATQTLPQAPKLTVQPVKPVSGMNVPKEQVFAETDGIYKAKLGEKVINLERGNQGTIAKINTDGSYLVHFRNKETGKEALIKMQREQFEPINQTIMDLKQRQIPKQQTPATSYKLDDATKQMLTEKAPTIKDIPNGFGQRNDIFEVIEKVDGKDGVIKRNVINPFLKSKGEAAKFEISKAKETYNEVVRNLGIKKGSKESAAVQWYGEKVRMVKNLVDPQTGKAVPTPTEVPYTLEMLKEDFPSKWENIVKADAYFRKNYDEMIDAINLKRAEIYPKAEENLLKIADRIEKIRTEQGRYATLDSTQRLALIKKLQLEQEHYMTGKIIPKRNDYYRHYKEMTEGFTALKNVFDSPAQIGSNLSGISQFTKPKAKWLSLAQQRGKGDYTADAVGGFLEYLPAASYSINIDPHIAKFRELADVLAEATDKSKNANNLVDVIRQYADHLSGKTSIADRALMQWMPGGRKGLKVLNWVNNRVKSNVILGNAGSALSQVANIPNGIAWIKDPESLAKGFSQTVKDLNGNGVINNSDFITERYKGNALMPFNDSLIGQPKKLAEWILGNADAVGTKFIWNSAYQKALKNGSKDAMQEADDVTRMLVAGRGIGEVPLNQQSNITKLIMPFTLEVQNAWKVQRKMVESKDFGGLIGLYLLSYGFNKGMEEIKGNGVLFDPIQAIHDAITEEDISPVQRVGRVAGEVISSIPLGSAIAGLYPEYGLNIMEGVEMPTRTELFGRNDPTRFGSGLVSQQAYTDPLFKLLPAWGGNQLKKTYDNAKSMQTIPNFNPLSEDFMQKQEISGAMKDGKLRFPIDKTPENYIKGGLFGNYATTNGKDYIKNEGRPFSEKQTESFKNMGADKGTFDFISTNRDLNNKGDIIKALETSELTDAQKNKIVTDFYEFKTVNFGKDYIPELVELNDYKKQYYNEKLKATGLAPKDYVSAFDNMDFNGSGAINQDEAKAWLDKSGYTKEQKAIMWNAIGKTWKHNPYV